MFANGRSQEEAIRDIVVLGAEEEEEEEGEVEAEVVVYLFCKPWSNGEEAKEGYTLGRVMPPYGVEERLNEIK